LGGSLLRTYLPLSKSREDQTLSEFKQELTDLINEKSYAYIVREVVPVEFDEL